MIYLLDENFPLNAAFDDEIIQEANSTYQLTFKFPTTDSKWTELKNEVLLVADDLHGEQYFSIFEVEKQHGYITIYANQVATLLNSYSINTISVDRANGFTVMNALVSSLKRPSPFTFFSDINSKHTINLKNVSVMEALVKDKHSIVGQWGGDLVRDKYSIRLLERAGVENESLFAYKKNMKSYQESASTKELKTRIHFRRVIESHDDNKKDQVFTATIDSPLIGKYKNIYEADMEVQDQDVVDQKTLEEYGKRYFRETLCDMVEESLEIDVIGQSDQPVSLFDTVSVFHERYNADLRKKITKYRFAPMRKKLVSIGFGKASQSFGSALGNLVENKVNERLDEKLSGRDKEYEAKVQKLVDNANAEYEKRAKKIENKVTDGIEEAKARAEVIKQEISSSIDQKIAEANTINENEIKEEFNAKYGDITVEMDQIKSTAELLKTNGEEIKGIIENLNIDFSTQLSNIQGKQARYKNETDKSIADLIKVSDGKADRSYVEQTVAGIKEQFSSFTFSGGPNLIRNSDFKNGTNEWTSTQNLGRLVKHGFYHNSQKYLMRLSNSTQSENFLYSTRFELERNTDYMLNFRGFNNSALVSYDVFILGRKAGETSGFSVAKKVVDGKKLSISRCEDVSITFNSGEIDNAFIRFDNNGARSGTADLYITEVDLYKGYKPRPWQPAPEDQEYIVTQAQASFERTAQGLTQKVTALETSAGGLASKIAEYKQTADGQFTKITSQLGDMLKKTDINITDGRISFGTGKSIDGRTISSLLVQDPESIALIAQLIKVKGDMVVDGSILGRHIASESVETGHMKSGSVTTQILASNSVTADKVLVDSAMIDKLVTNKAFVRELISQRAFITELNSIKIAAERVQGGRLSANNGSTVFDLDNGTLNLFSNTGTIRRIDDTSASQFIKFNQVGLIGEYLRDNKAARIVIGTNQDKTENTENGTFAGMRLWSGSQNNVKESLYELVGDRIIFYANGQYRSPWIIHNNTKDGNSYLIPMNEKGVKHNLGRGDKHFSKAYIDDLFIGKGSQNVGGYLWDILTCFGIIARYGWDLKNGAVQNHIKSNLINKYGFK